MRVSKTKADHRCDVVLGIVKVHAQAPCDVSGVFLQRMRIKLLSAHGHAAERDHFCDLSLSSLSLGRIV